MECINNIRYCIIAVQNAHHVQLNLNFLKFIIINHVLFVKLYKFIGKHCEYSILYVLIIPVNLSVYSFYVNVYTDYLCAVNIYMCAYFSLSVIFLS